MVSIQIVGKAPHPRLIQMLSRFLPDSGGYRIVSFDQPQPSDRNDLHTIYLFQDFYQPQPESIRNLPSERAIAIVNAENTAVLQQLSAADIPTIPCGLSDHDTITLASSTEDSLVVSLQRSLTAFSGETVEPMEFPVLTKLTRSLSRYQLMAFCAICCLTKHTTALTQFLSEDTLLD